MPDVIIQRLSGITSGDLLCLSPTGLLLGKSPSLTWDNPDETDKVIY